MSGTKESSPPAETEAEGEQPQQPNGDETSQNHANVPPTNIADPTNWKQSPFLEGKGLPPVQERLPKEPKLTNEMPPHELNLTIGKYGGTLRTIRFDPVWDGVVWTLNTEPLVNSPGRLGEEITPNVVRNFSVSPDQKEFTFELREGMKWSDGTPLTTEDVRFTVEDVIMNQELTPIFPQWLRAEGKAEGTPVRLEILDPLTFKLIFDEPYGGFLLQLTTGDYQDLIKPSHYLKSFHIKYADPEELEQKTAEAGFQRGEWFKLFNLKVASGWDSGKPEMIDYPVLYPYLHVKNGDVRLFERNPYYFKIDAEGNQLPYIDQVNSTLVQDLEVGALKILAGEVDFSYEWAPITKVPLYKQNEAKNGTKVLLNTTLHRTANDLFFNMTYEDPTWRKVARDLRFRQALNLALDKAEIVDTVYYGLARPSEMQGTEYNLEEANRLLDEIGMKKGSDGIRTGPDGQKFTMYFTYAAAFPTNQPTAELVAEQWKLLGLDIQLKQVESTLLDTMIEANQVQVTTTFTHGPVMAPWTDWAFNHWGRLWNLWYTTNGAQGERPPDEVLNFYKMVESLRKLPLEEARKKRAELHEEMKQNLWYLIPVDQIVQPVVKNAKLRNLDDAGYQIANSFGGEQWWFDD
jgi:peptide/nickel transport system substrate-binding protein